VNAEAGAAPSLARPWGGPAALVFGCLILAALWLSPLVPASRTAFSVHMLLHLGVVSVAAPILAWGLSRYLPGLHRAGEALSWCLLASFFEMVAVWGWHVPILHDAAGYHDWAFVLEQLSFLAGGLAMWTAAFSARTRGASGAAAFGLFLTFTHMSAFGIVLTLAPRLIYDPNLCRGAFGLDRLEDQHLGGVLMAVGGGLPYLAGTGWAAWRALRERFVA
jgi:putative membrane protein